MNPLLDALGLGFLATAPRTTHPACEFPVSPCRPTDEERLRREIELLAPMSPLTEEQKASLARQMQQDHDRMKREQEYWSRAEIGRKPPLTQREKEEIEIRMGWFQ